MREPILYPRAYGFYIALAAADVLLTTLILSVGGVELNAIARVAFSEGGITAAAFLKFSTVCFVLIACEIVGRRRHQWGVGLAHVAVMVSIVPVTVGVLEIIDAVRYGLITI
jgi:hypothetical protein